MIMKRQNIKYRGLLGLVMSSIIVSFSGLQLAKAEFIPELLISVYFPGGVKRPPTEKTKGGGTRGTFCVTKNDLKEDDLKNYFAQGKFYVKPHLKPYNKLFDS